MILRIVKAHLDFYKWSKFSPKREEILERIFAIDKNHPLYIQSICTYLEYYTNGESFSKVV